MQDAALHWAARITPKVEQITIHTGGCIDDQGLALLDAMKSSGLEIPVNWLVDTSCAPRCIAGMRRHLPSGFPLEFIPRRTHKGIRSFASSRYVFFSHGLFGSMPPPSRSTYVNMWHGMPFKRIGGRTVHATHTLATSDSWSTILADSFNQPVDRIRPIGLPRNDRLHDATEIDRIRKVLGAKNKPLVAWIPTYRRTRFSPSTTHGADFDSPFNLPDSSEVEVEAHARQRGLKIVLKPHPYALKQQQEKPHSDHLSTVSTEFLNTNGISLYALLAASDALVTDYSSVWIDYLMTDKPIIFVTRDIESYERDRGFNLAPPTSWLPGPHSTTIEETFHNISDSLHDDTYAAARAIARQYHHAHSDDQASQRLLELVFN